MVPGPEDRGHARFADASALIQPVQECDLGCTLVPSFFSTILPQGKKREGEREKKRKKKQVTKCLSIISCIKIGRLMERGGEKSYGRVGNSNAFTTTEFFNKLPDT